MKKLGIILTCAVAALGGMIIIGLAVATPDTNAIHKAKTAVEAQLRDAGSAAYRNVAAYHQSDGTIVVCGEVNSANAFGALAGYARFFSVNGQAVVDSASGTQAFETLWHAEGCDGSQGIASAFQS